MRADRARRVVRGVVVAGVAVLVASLAHTVGGGTPPGALALVVALAFAVPFSVLVSGRRARSIRTALSAGATQLALHVCYSLSAGESALGAPIHGGGHAHGADAAAFAAALGAGDAASAAGGHDGPLMFAAHLVAAVVAIAALLVADRALDAGARAVATARVRLGAVLALFARGPALVASPYRVVPPVARSIGHPPLVLLRAVLAHRGPPLGSVAA